MPRTTYTAHAQRSGSWWAIDVLEIDGVYSQARRIDQIEAAARDAIATMLDTRPDSFDVHVEPVLDELPLLDDLARLDNEITTLTKQRAERIRLVAAKLHANGLPLRDVGWLLGVSHQRVHQLLDH